MWALVLAVIALALGAVGRLRAPRNGSKGAPPHGAILLIPCAIIIGTLPKVLQLGETVASVTSIVVSLVAMGLLILQATRTRRA